MTNMAMPQHNTPAFGAIKLKNGTPFPSRLFCLT